MAKEKMNYDLHIHTVYCGHAETMTIDAILKCADELGLNTICIADHIYSPKEIDTPRRIREEVAAYKTNCRVLIGAEMDVSGLHSDGTLAAPIPRGLDYCLAAIHYIPGDGFYPRKIEDNPLSPKELLKRWRSTMLGVLNNKKINALAHPGRMVATSIDMDLYFDDVLEILTEAAEVAAANNILWEINEHDRNMVRQDYHNRWHEIYRIALDAGVKLIYGSDSHFPNEIGGNEFVSNILKKLPEGCLETPESIGLI
ncbi:MAG: PHP domain-containing protein [Sedimentisphaerales bacterium]|nr:PHP domain-containing protein [Sedimentisphaerales bacterium]